MLPARLRVFGRWPRRGIGGLRALDRHHPQRPHWYLDYVAVEPGRPGPRRGLGAACADARALRRRGPWRYLNAGSPRSRDLYLRHGFEVAAELRLPFGGPPLWRMWREPRPPSVPSVVQRLRRPPRRASVRRMASFAGGLIECFAGPREKQRAGRPRGGDRRLHRRGAQRAPGRRAGARQRADRAGAPATRSSSAASTSRCSSSRTTCVERWSSPTSSACACPARPTGGRAAAGRVGRRRAAARRQPAPARRAAARGDRRQGRPQPGDLPPEVRASATTRRRPARPRRCCPARPTSPSPTRTATSTTSSSSTTRGSRRSTPPSSTQLRAGDFGRGAARRRAAARTTSPGRPGEGAVRARPHAGARARQADAQARELDARSTSRSSRSPDCSAHRRRADARSPAAGCSIRGVLDRGQDRTRTWSGAWRLHEPRIELFLPEAGLGRCARSTTS